MRHDFRPRPLCPICKICTSSDHSITAQMIEWPSFFMLCNWNINYNFLQQSKFSWANYYQRCPSQVCLSQVSVNSNVSRTAAFSSWHLRVAYFLGSFSVNILHEWERFHHVVSLFNISVYWDLESSFTEAALYIESLNPALSDGIKAINEDLNHFMWGLLFSLLYFRLFWLFMSP